MAERGGKREEEAPSLPLSSSMRRKVGGEKRKEEHCSIAAVTKAKVNSQNTLKMYYSVENIHSSALCIR